MRPLHRLVLAALMALPFSSAHAEQYLTLGAGWFNFSRSEKDSTNFGAEYRGNYFFYNLYPVIGGNVNTDGGALGYAGLNYDIEFSPHWILTPGLAVGAWGRGDSLDLGGILEFHESAEIDYRFDNNYRAGLQINHTSNAHIYDRNPGANSLMATFSIPLGN